MKETNHVIAIKILDRTYKIKCPPDQAQELMEAARNLDEQMKKIQHAGNITSVDRIAIVAALNIGHELMVIKKQKSDTIDSMHTRIQDLQHRIQNFLATEEEIAV